MSRKNTLYFCPMCSWVSDNPEARTKLIDHIKDWHMGETQMNSEKAEESATETEEGQGVSERSASTYRRATATKAEQRMMELLSAAKIPYEWQWPVLQDGKRADGTPKFYWLDFRIVTEPPIALEIDGPIHAGREEEDAKREAFLKMFGLPCAQVQQLRGDAPSQGRGRDDSDGDAEGMTPQTTLTEDAPMILDATCSDRKIWPRALLR